MYERVCVRVCGFVCMCVCSCVCARTPIMHVSALVLCEHMLAQRGRHFHAVFAKHNKMSQELSKQALCLAALHGHVLVRDSYKACCQVQTL